MPLPVEGPLLVLAAFFAGAVDAVVGGGGLIQVPALFAVYPQASPATLFGTNKMASVWGTANAAWRYARHIAIPWRVVLPAAFTAFVFAYLGALSVAWLPKDAVRPVVLILLVLVTGHTLLRKDLGLHHRPRFAGSAALFAALLLGGAIGFYDGFFGPGTGSFLVFLLVRGFGFDFMHASAGAKIINVATNVAALLFFVPQGYWLPEVALAMALANVVGSIAGSALALRWGSVFVRRVFLLGAGALILRFAWDTLRA